MAMFQGRDLALFPRVLDARSIVPSPVIIQISAAEEDSSPSLCTAGVASTFSDLMTLWYTVSVIIDKPALFHPATWAPLPELISYEPDTRLEAALFGCPTGERIRTGGRQIAADALITLRLHPPPGGAAEGGAYLRYGLQVKITEAATISPRLSNQDPPTNGQDCRHRLAGITCRGQVSNVPIGGSSIL
ncbi:uncharacterized protein BO96DRAFT_436943 [Aspergillus niger CBS 101883]|uniref:uncharacterized protein n=1 Tax=Aspergillus lacticoffeatus (strain CBS 101883) TaxID=1450533 RepID=UPI000D80288F|nr:uncharacterized protein BO96DRAFT_436943 [Aspergillus niger CBS 101883]PYH53654.1 hypothetical protein BO96DRAFT_436943 [Aspergillus niger CBS 101883]